jgi:DNA-binding transcriptional regulator LsrR (DeoR family)
VKSAIAARGLAGETQAALARDFNVSRDFVKRCVENARTQDPEQALVMRQHLPDEYLKVAYLTNQRTLQAVVAGDQKAATGWAFASKLATESNRWADKIGDGTGATMLEFIKALNAAGGGSVTVAVNGSVDAPVIEAEVIRP